MKKYIDSYGKDIQDVKREDLHREVEMMLAYRNLMNCQRVYLELIEDLYHFSLDINDILWCLDQVEEVLDSDIIEECRDIAEGCEERLKRWEIHLLNHSLCSEEPCY